MKLTGKITTTISTAAILAMFVVPNMVSATVQEDFLADMDPTITTGEMLLLASNGYQEQSRENEQSNEQSNEQDQDHGDDDGDDDDDDSDDDDSDDDDSDDDDSGDDDSGDDDSDNDNS
ncbi:MAG: phosphopantothenoylcysteine synthetase/decarboxylase [Desulforhopalus sp.]|jgi:phosphopantothenoylcysteine synthetase/decarboxylase